MNSKSIVKTTTEKENNKTNKHGPATLIKIPVKAKDHHSTKYGSINWILE